MKSWQKWAVGIGALLVGIGVALWLWFSSQKAATSGTTATIHEPGKPPVDIGPTPTPTPPRPPDVAYTGKVGDVVTVGSTTGVNSVAKAGPKGEPGACFTVAGGGSDVSVQFMKAAGWDDGAGRQATAAGAVVALNFATANPSIWLTYDSTTNTVQYRNAWTGRCA